MTTTGFEVAGLDGDRVSLHTREIEALGASIEGSLLSPGDDGWDEAVLVWNGMVAKMPALIVQPATPHDVAAAVAFAREHRLLLSIKGGGHNIAGTCIAEGGLTLDMSRLREVAVHSQARLVHVGAGCRLGDVDRATQQYGLATVLGFISETGVAGLTLGGGLGYLTRRFGWTVDNLEEVEIVTADARMCTANRRDNADLFWAIRGGGGNFGVVTRFTFRLHEVGPTVFGGIIAWPFDRCGDVMEGYRRVGLDAPRELSAWLILMRAPPLPFVPAAWHGERICAMAVCYSGDPSRREDAIAPIRAIGDPLVDVLHEQPYVQIQSYLDAGEPKGMHYYWKTAFAAELSDDLLARTRQLYTRCPIPRAEVGFLHLGGAINERAWDDGAVGNRDVRYAIGVNGMWEPGDPDADSHRRWIREAYEQLRPYTAGRTYINFQTADDGDDRVQATYGENYARLREIKRKYDPDNLFRMNRNVPPAD